MRWSAIERTPAGSVAGVSEGVFDHVAVPEKTAMPPRASITVRDDAPQPLANRRAIADSVASRPDSDARGVSVVLAGQGSREFGMGRGKVFPASSAPSLLHPLRRLVQSPRRTCRATGIQPGNRVLEVGCGPGFFSPDLRRACSGGLLVALDLQPEMLALVRGRLVGAGAVVSADSMTLPFPAECFDAVFVATMLGEVPDAGVAVRELRRVLVPGGTASFAETRRDSDFIALSALRRLVEPAGFKLKARRGWSWQYVANFETVPRTW
jgi:SAM-dependent methyltransferase